MHDYKKKKKNDKQNITQEKCNVTNILICHLSFTVSCTEIIRY